MTVLQTWSCEYSKARPWRGYCRARTDARACGWRVVQKKTERLRCAKGSWVTICRHHKRRGSSTIEAPVSAQDRNHVWAIDFQVEHLKVGTGFKMAPTVDEHTRIILNNTVDVIIAGEDLGGL